jgi:hypothetical protein
MVGSVVVVVVVAFVVGGVDVVEWVHAVSICVFR